MKYSFTSWFCMAALVLPMAACKKRHPPTHSDLKHQTDALLRSDASVLWLGSNAYEEIQRKSDNYLAVNHPVTERVRYWSETLHTLTTERFPALAMVPKPSALVVKDREANAYVQGEKVCVEVPIKREGRNNSSPMPFQQSIQLGAGSFTTASRLDSCVEKSLNAKERAKLIALFNNAGTVCQLTEKNTFIEASDGCFTTNPSIRTLTSASSISFTTTKPIIFVHTGMFLQVNDLELATVVAHELGHYYRAHSSSLLAPVSYLFRHSQYDMNGVPKPAPELYDLSTRWQRTFRMSLYKQPTRLTDLHPASMRKYRQWVSFMRQTCAENKCPKSCNRAYELSLSFPDSYGTAEQGERMDPAEDKFYEDFSAQIFNCGKDLPPTNGIFIDASFILGIETNTIPGEFGGARNFAEQLRYSSRLVSDIEKDVLELQDLVEKEQLGWYTEEQEADDILLEIIGHAGIAPTNAISYRLKALTQWSKESKIPVIGQWEAAPCLKSFERGWKNDKGESVIVPVGMWEDSHHSACYRLFNITQELARHKYQQIAPRVRSMHDRQFRVLQELIIKDNEGFGFANDHDKRWRWY